MLPPAASNALIHLNFRQEWSSGSAYFLALKAAGRLEKFVVVPIFRKVSSDELPPIFTIGHSTKSIADFVELLRAGQADFVVDIRTVPRSRTNPQYNLDALGPSLAEYQIGHCRIGELGGLRSKAKAIPPETNGFWNNRSFHNYADYALSQTFADGLSELLELSEKRRCAIMCAEAVWWRCHRRIVADYLLFRGRSVFHLMGNDRVEPAKMTPAATPQGDQLVYPAD